TWKSFTPEQKQLHVRQAAWMSAKQAIGNFIISNEAALKSVVEKKGVKVIKPDEETAKAWDEVIAGFAKTNRASTIAAGEKLGVADAGKLVDDYQSTIEKWRERSKEIGRDVDKFTEVLMTEVFSKIDLE